MSTDNTAPGDSSTSSIDTLRELLFATLRDVRAGTIDIDRARAVNDIGKTLVESARVEVAYLQANNGGESTFLNGTVGNNNLPPGVVRHRLK